MNDRSTAAVAGPHPSPYRPQLYLSMIMVGLLLLVLGFLTVLNGNTQATKNLVHRGDCRAQHQGDYFKELASLLVEATSAHPDPGLAASEAEKVNADADAYLHCTDASTPTLPKVSVSVSSGTVSVSTTSSP